MNELSKMQRSQEEAEVVIQLDFKTRTANICVSDWPDQARRFSKMLGEPRRVDRQSSRQKADGEIVAIDHVRSAYWTVPLETLRVSKRVRRVLTPEQRKTQAQQMKKLREAKRQPTVA